MAGFKDAEEIDYFDLMSKSEEEIATYIPERFAWFTLRTSVNSNLREVLNDKWITQIYLDSIGIRMPRLIGLWHPRSGMTPDGQPMCTPEQLAAQVAPQIAQDRYIDLFFKPQAGRGGYDAFSARLAKTGDGMQATLLDGQTKPLKIFLAELPTVSVSYFDTASQGWIIQEKVRQHPTLNSLNKSSLNGVRMITYYELPIDGRSDGNEAKAEYGYLRVGPAGMEIDSSGCGPGMSVAVDFETGALKSSGRFGQHFGGGYVETHPDSGVRFEDLTLPFWTEAKDLCSKAARAFPSIRMIAWDVAFAEDGPVIVEGNGGWNQKSLQSLGQGYLTPERRARFEREGIPLPPRKLPSIYSVVIERLRHKLGGFLPQKRS
jgi:hypothetical protein